MRTAGLLIMAIFIGILFHQPAAATEIEIHGALNHRFQYTNRADFLTADSTTNRAEINDGDVDEWFGEIKYRLWLNAASDDGDVKGVVGTEIGGLRFGEPGKMPFSGDQIQFKVWWAYADIQLPQIERAARFKIGLQPFTVNRYIWSETVGGVAFNSTIGDTMKYTLAWMRGAEYDKTAENSDDDDDRTDLDSFLARFDMQAGDALDGGLFALYQTFDSDGTAGALDSRDYEIKQFGTNIDFNLLSLGLDGILGKDTFKINWDLIYQTGEVNNLDFTDFASGLGRTGDFDLSAYFFHVGAEAEFGNIGLNYTFWYASGDDNPTDGDFDAFIATDVDITKSIVLFKGNYADDNYFTEVPYIADKGFIMNRLGVDFTVTDKLLIGGALLYMLTAEDFEYTAAATSTAESSNELGFEVDAFVKYLLYENVEVAWNAGYLFAGDALDVYEIDAIQDGSSDEDLYITSARVVVSF